MNDPINEHTNVDNLSKEGLMEEASLSKNRARIKLLRRIHAELAAEQSMESNYEYDQNNDMSFSGEFEAIGV